MTIGVLVRLCTAWGTCCVRALCGFARGTGTRTWTRCSAVEANASRFVDQLSSEGNLDVLKQGILSNGMRRIREESRGSEDFLVIDVDDVPFLADGHQPGSRYCGYVGHRCYSALVAVSGESGDILGARLRRPEEDKTGETFDFVLPIVAGALEEGGGRPVMVRMDAGFPDGRTLAEFDALNIRYLARIRNNAVLNRMAEPHLHTPTDMAPGEVRTVFHENEYQAKDWDRKRRVALVVIFSEGELFPRYFWLSTSLAREHVGAEELLARYRARGRAENSFGELKSTLRAQLPPLRGRSATMPARRSTARSLLSHRSGDRRTKPFSCSPGSDIKPCTRVAARWRVPPGRAGASAPSAKRVLRAGCRVARHARRMKFHIPQSVASYRSILLAQLKKSTMQNAWFTRLVRLSHPLRSRQNRRAMASGCANIRVASYKHAKCDEPAR